MVKKKGIVSVNEVSYKNDSKPSDSEVGEAHKIVMAIKREVSKAVVGQDKVVNMLINALLCNGHVLVEGVPGIAKTLLIKTLAHVTGGTSERIQFTVDLLPTDVVGITTYNPKKGFEVVKGPIFANFVIADEINRSPPKTQSALIEAMQEKQVTIGKETFKLPLPFFVMANQNPLEQSGVYTLPEAQVDRFLFKIIMGYPTYEEEDKIMVENTTTRKFEDIQIDSITNPGEIIRLQELTKRVYLSPEIRKHILKIVRKTREKDFEFGEYVEWGCSPRASIAIFIASKANALLNGRNFVIPADIGDVAHDILRHRIILSYRAKAEGITPDKVISTILEKEIG
jgi:MoxR-like ATPase